MATARATSSAPSFEEILGIGTERKADRKRKLAGSRKPIPNQTSTSAVDGGF